ncbi:hypothetical protein Goklo_021684, partial [Gossypium klotzschianum]|nr:hypothetical protein [Gossypium klotzschianum]
GYQICVFKHVPKQANGVAHLLGTEGLKRDEETYLVGAVPSYAKVAAEEDRQQLGLLCPADRRIDGLLGFSVSTEDWCFEVMQSLARPEGFLPVASERSRADILWLSTKQRRHLKGFAFSDNGLANKDDSSIRITSPLTIQKDNEWIGVASRGIFDIDDASKDMEAIHFTANIHCRKVGEAGCNMLELSFTTQLVRILKVKKCGARIVYKKDLKK